MLHILITYSGHKATSNTYSTRTITNPTTKMVRFTIAMAAAACASVSLAGPIVGPATGADGGVAVMVQPEHADNAFILLPPPTRRETGESLFSFTQVCRL